MGKQSWRGGNMLYPVPAVMVSCARPGEKPNIITVAWAGTVCSAPAMLSISVRKERYSYDIIKETGTMVVNNPQSNQGNAVGCSPVLQMMAKGITVGMGTDAYTHDMLESMKAFLTIQRHNAMLPNVGWCEDVKMQFENNRIIAEKYFGKTLGILKEGAAADIIIMDYKPFTPFSDENIDGHMIFGMEGKNCRTTIINGKVLYKDREFVDLDEDKINAWTMEQSKKLWGKLNHRVY